jgi:hypothetical protein
MVWNNLTTLSTCITFAATSSTDFGVLICVVQFLDLFAKDPNFCINILPNPNSNGCLSIDHGLLTNTYNFGGLSIATGVCVPTLYVYNLVACRPLCVYSYCCCKCYCKCWKCCGL